jgi:hypothetical protein
VFLQALGMRVAKASAATPCSGEILGDVECVHMLLGGFTGPCRGVAQVAVCDRPERIDPGYLYGSSRRQCLLLGRRPPHVWWSPLR